MEKKLCKNRDAEMLCGVCAGIGDYFGIDYTLVRLIWVLFCLAGGSGILLYIIMSLIMPEK